MSEREQPLAEAREHARTSAEFHKQDQIIYAYMRGRSRQYGWCSVTAWQSQSRCCCTPVARVLYLAGAT